MKTLVFANQKGGVGKSAIATQFAYYLNLLRGLRVLVIDLDHQRNTTKALRTGEIAAVAAVNASALLSTAGQRVDVAPFVLVPGDLGLIGLEKQGTPIHNSYASNLIAFLEAHDDDFDVCVIDTNPNPDIRQLAALVASDFVLSPIQLNQEAIDGIGELLNSERIGVRRIVATKLNERLKLLGILPNLVEPTPFQRENFEALATAHAKLLIPMGSGFAALKKSTAIAEAQSAGLPVWKLGKTSGRDSWAQMKPVFETITANMGVK